MEQKRKAEYRRNVYVFIVLALLTLGEFFIAINLENPAVPLMIVALIKAGLIIYYFMHVYRLWREEEHG